MKGYLARLLAPRGFVIEAGTSANTTGHYGIAFREDTVVAAWEDEDAKDLLAYYGMSGVTYKQTDPALLVPFNKKGVTITLTSGSICILK